MKQAAYSLLAIFALASLSAAQAAAYIPTFGSTSSLGTTVITDKWTNFSAENHPGYPDISHMTDPWPAPLGPDTAYNTPSPTNPQNAFFQRNPNFSTDGTDFLNNSFSGGVYVGGSFTNFEVTASNLLAGLQTLNFQISMAAGADGTSIIGGPFLTLTTSLGDVLPPVPSAVTLDSFSTTIVFPTTVYLKSYTWDLSSVAGTIQSLKIDWQVDQHSITYGMQMAQAVPEPTTWALLIVGAGVVLMRNRRKLLSVISS